MPILPTKHTTVARSLLGVGAVLLLNLGAPSSVSALWEAMRDHPSVGSYTRFLLGLEVLYLLGAIDLSEGQLRRVSR